MTTTTSPLTQPLRIGPMEVKNRMGVTAMGVSFAEEDGGAGDQMIAYHRRQAEGGVGLITLGATAVAYPVGGVQVRQSAVSDDRMIPGLRRMADAVHAAGGKIAAQLHFGGLQATIDIFENRPLWCPSLPPQETGDFMDGFLAEELEIARIPKTTVQMKVMDKHDIAQLIDWFAAGARRAREAGFDGVEIHGGHGYIISSFLSPVTNMRTDEYGGSRENRARLMVEVIRAVRDAAGPDMAVWVKIDGVEHGRKGGLTVADACIHAKLAEEAGAQAIVVTAYHNTSVGILHSASHTPHAPGMNIDNAARIKAAVKIPVICSGRIEPEMAERAIANGKFDMMYMGRKMLADPDLPRKITEGRRDDILPCIYCYTCISQIYLGRSAKCAVNPETGSEFAWKREKANPPQRVAVIGGGPAGMEAARRLSAKGHQVTLFERSDRLGGTLNFAAVAYEPNERLLRWLKRQIAASPVDVRLNTTATPDLLRAMGIDTVVVATGAVRALPPIPGADRNNVFSGDELRKLILADDLGALSHKVSGTGRLLARLGAMMGITSDPARVRSASSAWMPFGRNIVIIGGELVGLELAEFLNHRGRKVTVVDEPEKFGAGLALVRRLRLLTELREAGVALRPGATDIAIGGGEVTWRNADGNAERAAADHVIIAKGATGDTGLADQLAAAGFTVHVAGDAGGVGYIEGAMHGGARAAMAI
jgi:2,4-dienoyl-CoA reductase-like NADH-dependent reductase (Old Yellow Enzyme family)/NADPH-dependent 2,4-dienoyl-CoA reductase/sulfur reductase-like enzyme